MKTGGHNICFSGGAEGADVAWGEAADGFVDHRVVHYSFLGHKAAVPHPYILTGVQLEQSVVHAALTYANQTLGRTWPSKHEYINNLLRRTYHVIRHAQTVYAVAPINPGQAGAPLQGGTAWGVQMALDVRKQVFVFDLLTKGWYTWAEMGGRRWWEPIARPPFPMGWYAGIGSRDITPEGLAAIRDVYTQQQAFNVEP